ncbi:MAG: Csac_0668 family 2Fe-2S cluster-binding (seleno)protein [Sedimentibacter sp.]
MNNKESDKCCCENIIEESNSTDKNLCPRCKRQGKLVENFTVKHMVSKELMEQVGEDDYYLCMSEDCDITYYSPKECAEFSKQQLNVPIWFKKDANPKYACYCSKVTEEQVINAVIKDGATNMQEVLKITGAMKNSNCRKNNPLGKCCHQIIQSAINKGLFMK